MPPVKHSRSPEGYRVKTDIVPVLKKLTNKQKYTNKCTTRSVGYSNRDTGEFYEDRELGERTSAENEGGSWEDLTERLHLNYMMKNLWKKMGGHRDRLLKSSGKKY